MKKKLFTSILVLFIFSVCLIRANAATTQYPPLFNVSWKIKAVAPKLSGESLVLPANDLAYGTVSGAFDFSKVIFADATGNDLPGKSNLEKIIIGELQKSEITGNNDAKKAVGTLLKDYFTAYCLDEGKKYPAYGLFNSGGWVNDDIGLAVGYSQAVNPDGTYNDSSNQDALDISIVLASIMNDSSFSTLANDLLTQFNDAASISVISEGGVSIESITDGKDINDYYLYLMGQSNTPVQIGLKYIGFNSTNPAESSKEVYYASNSQTKEELEGDHPDATVRYIKGSAYSNEYVPLTGKLADLAFQKYNSSTDLTVLNNYNHALWIVENSYPTLSIDVALSKAGVNVDTFNTQVKTLYSTSDSDLADYKEMVVYGIVQYAIWHVTNTSVAGDRIGNQIKGAGSTELNKFYQYLINEDNVPSGYGNASIFSNKIKVTAPEEGKELNKRTDDYDYYGPYTATYFALVEEGNEIQFNIQNNSDNDIKIVDSSLKVISQISKGEEFYIRTPKKKAFTSLDVDLTASGIVTFVPKESRGRIYNPVSAISQNALIGGKTSTISIGASITIAGNPETGVQNVALLLMVTLVAFTLGYLVLTYKQKPIQLKQ